MKKQNKKLISLLPYIISIVFLTVYVILAIHYIQIIEPVMDEGTYLLKGKWYWEGTYQPFEENGPLTNKPPFAFYSLGISQILFPPGLASGRYFAIFLSILLLIGQWLTVKRLAGTWWAVFSIALYAISPAWIIYYSRAMTEVVTALLIVWSLYFLLGDGRKQWQLILGTILATLVVMVRQNLLPLFIFTLIYICWENGFRKSLAPVLAGVLAFIGFNSLYWPEIYFYIWKPYFPGFLNDFFINIFNLEIPAGNLGTALLDRGYGILYETQVLFDGVRYFFIPILATILSFIVLSPKKMFCEKAQRKTTFLAFSFLFLTILHFYYVVLKNNILYSFPAYLAFFLPLAVTLIPLIYKEILEIKDKTRQWILSLSVVLFCTGIGLSLYREIAPFFMDIHLPSINEKTFHGPYPLWDVLLNRFYIPVQTQEFLIPTVVGFLAGILILILAVIIKNTLQRKKKAISYGSAVVLLTLGLGYLFTPTFILAGHSSIPTCSNFDYSAEYEEMGENLQKIIPANSHVYIEGYDPIIFLYLPNIQIYPAQLNKQFNFRNGGDASFVEKRGYWNDELAFQWIQEADFLIFNQETYEQRFLPLDPELQSLFKQLEDHITPELCNMSEMIILEKIAQ
ncbi:MAG: ArnT family glycosyltransferase [Anaerolineaceae bacterium]